jgi:hypothetical protein
MNSSLSFSFEAAVEGKILYGRTGVIPPSVNDYPETGFVGNKKKVPFGR